MFFIEKKKVNDLDYVSMTKPDCFCTELSTSFSKLSTFA